MRISIIALSVIVYLGSTNVLASEEPGPYLTSWISTGVDTWYRELTDGGHAIRATVTKLHPQEIVEYAVEAPCWIWNENTVLLLGHNRIQTWILGDERGNSVGCNQSWYTEQSEVIDEWEKVFGLPPDLIKENTGVEI